MRTAPAPETIVFGGRGDVDDQVRDTPLNDPPKPPAETESHRNFGSTVFGMAHEVGYARVSKREQNPDAQEAELRAAGCERVFVDHGESSRVADRPQWLACLDRLAGSERILIETLQDLDARQVNIVSLTEPTPASQAQPPPNAFTTSRGTTTSAVARCSSTMRETTSAPGAITAATDPT